MDRKTQILTQKNYFFNKLTIKYLCFTRPNFFKKTKIILENLSANAYVKELERVFFDKETVKNLTLNQKGVLL